MSHLEAAPGMVSDALRRSDVRSVRRRLLGALIAGSSLLAREGRAQTAENFLSLPRYLWLQRAETGEEIKVIYWQDGQLVEQGYVMACVLLRDVRANQGVRMDLALLDVLCGAQNWFRAYGYHLPFTVSSGYRTAETNRALAPEGAVYNSLHVAGRACDGKVVGVPADYLGRLALHLRGGGVGIYAGKGFVHIDTGRIRTWRG